MAKIVEPASPPAVWDTAFEPYARAVGYMLREWNDLQERFATLFTTIVNNDRPSVARAAWYAVKNDRTQRQMLCAAADAMFPVGEDVPHKTLRENHRVRNAISWVTVKADDLGFGRDAAAHSPVALLLGEPMQFIPRDYFENPLAMRLKGKDLLGEFEHYRATARALRAYVSGLNSYLRNEPPSPFPKKPVLPVRPHQTPKAGRPHEPL